MTTSLTFHGAAGTVTGSKFLLEHDRRRVLVDCGLYQGEREWRRLNWAPLPFAPSSLADVVLTHAHLDHCGYLPALVRQGFTGPVWATRGTADLAAIVLRDSAHLQEEDAEYARQGGWSRHDPPLPLYTAADAERAIAILRTRGFGQLEPLGPDVAVTFHRAGHILGSSTVLLEAGSASVLFSGDLGRPGHDLLLPREDPPAARTVVVESTYGDREHPEPGAEEHAAFADAIRRTIRRGGSVVVPAFAVDRTELVLVTLAELLKRDAIPDVPIWVDSPMALRALEVYRRAEYRRELLPEAAAALDRLDGLHAARTAEESIALNHPRQPCIIISASGMASGGRVVHHLQHLLPDRRNAVVLTGYQAVGTRGRALAEGAREVKIMGRYVPVRAEVVVDEEFSVHADASELLEWLVRIPRPPETVYVVHGEPEAAHALAGRIRHEMGWTVAVPRLGERVLVG
ncbi:MAG TPA: MBL fold metallo-hydrolase [Pedococcus sp.]